MASNNNDLARLALLADKITEFKSSQISAVSRGNAAEFTGEIMMVREDSMAATSREMLKQMTATQQEFNQRITKLTRQLTLQKERPQQEYQFWRRRSRSRNGHSPVRRRSQSTERNTGLCFRSTIWNTSLCRCISPCT